MHPEYLHICGQGAAKKRKLESDAAEDYVTKAPFKKKGKSKE